MIGLLTPPVGMVLYILARVADISFERTTKACAPFLVPLVLTLNSRDLRAVPVVVAAVDVLPLDPVHAIGGGTPRARRLKPSRASSKILLLLGNAAKLGRET